MRKPSWWLAMAALIAVAGCASTPQASRERDADAKAFDVHPGAATVYVYRSPFNTDIEDNVLYIDGRLIGSTVPGTYFRVNLTPGRHTLHGSGIDLGTLTIDARPGQLYFVDLAVIAGHSRYQLVPPAEAKRAIATCCVLLENWAPGQRPLLR
ncbi:MAG: DUF2846 domain-containing protein [Rhodospirillaceae bacterium]